MTAETKTNRDENWQVGLWPLSMYQKGRVALRLYWSRGLFKNCTSTSAIQRSIAIGARLLCVSMRMKCALQTGLLTQEMQSGF